MDVEEDRGDRPPEKGEKEEDTFSYECSRDPILLLMLAGAQIRAAVRRGGSILYTIWWPTLF